MPHVGKIYLFSFLVEERKERCELPRDMLILVPEIEISCKFSVYQPRA